MRLISIATLVLLAACAAPPRATKPQELPGFRTVETAITTQIKKGASVTAERTGYLGVLLDGRVVVDVAPDSPAAKAGIKPGDEISRFQGEDLFDAEDFRERMQAVEPESEVKLVVEREGKEIEVTARAGAASRPMRLAEKRGLMGISIGEPRDEGGAPVTRVTRGLPAEKAGVKNGDVLLEIDGVPVTSAAQLTDKVAEKSAGETVTLKFEKQGEVKITLAAAESEEFFRGSSLWKKEAYRLAIVGVEYPDAKHNEKIANADWEESLFSKGTYVNKTCATGQKVYGSLNDYYQEQSCGALRIEGKMLGWVEVSKKRMDYATGSKSPFLTEALDKIGADALKDYDGVFFLYAGGRVNTNRGGLYWPHRSNVTYKGKRVSYFIVPEGGTRMTSISVIAHEFGHMLGLPDLYARPENPGSEGLGSWCAMSNQQGSGRPQHFGAWCKEQLGWLKPVVIDPRVKQRLLLGPVEGSSKECFKVLIRPDGSEYLLLENRRKKGFDSGLAAEGLVIWRVVRSRPILEESHGVEGPQGPNLFTTQVPYPTAANDAYTPFTIPSSRSQLGGGWPVHITNIRRMEDGRISFSIGYEYD